MDPRRHFYIVQESLQGDYLWTTAEIVIPYLLVDDEEDVIRIIMKKLDWESMGLDHYRPCS